MKILGYCLVIVGTCLSNIACSGREVVAYEKPAGWETVAVRDLFSFDAPSDITEKPVQGTDSVVGVYQFDDVELSFDYGMYSSTLEESSALAGYSRQKVTVYGCDAELVQTDEGQTGIVFPEVPAGPKLTLHATYTKPESGAVVKKILLSIRFTKASQL